MAGVKGNKAHANKTSYPNQKNNKKHPNVVLRKFSAMVENAKSDEEILCFQDACMSIGWRSSKVEYWSKKIPNIENIKNYIRDIINSRINKKALRGNFNPTASIWRMKQLGEKDTQEIKNTGSLDIRTIKFKKFNNE